MTLNNDNYKEHLGLKPKGSIYINIIHYKYKCIMYMLLISIKVYSFIVKDKNKSKYRVYILYLIYFIYLL